ncbi:LysR family transcriptional regulator [Telmatospirillum sp. J64-1]|uniref:LysR family transcriptional regulator n=1 Tax=Telmatospirillum sp. J64-1 TaxID=2502183 RepID=UPI00115C558B|nr:LysR family transcriptional regulator [Telmatospirillum sp. J64-1]
MDRATSMAVFVRVVEEGGFAAAARVLDMSRAMVSKHVAALEDRLGARLLNRTTRRLSLTEIGAAYYERCAELVAGMEEAERLVGAMHAEPRGLLKVNAPMSFGFLHLAPAVADYLAHYPQVRIDMTLNDRLVDVVEEGYDLAIRIGALKDSALVARRLAPSRLAVCASPDYLARRGEPGRPEELRGHDCLGYSLSSLRDSWVFLDPATGQEVQVPITGSLRANNGDALAEAAVRGLGIVLQPTFLVVEHLRQGRLKQILRGFPCRENAVYALYPPGRPVAAKLRSFIDFLVERFGPKPYWEEGLG